MRTLVISDLHLGTKAQVDLLRRTDVREQLLAALQDIDRLVILGDVMELRDGPLQATVERVTPFFNDIGKALGPDKEVLLLAGNHDHGMMAGWIDLRLQTEQAGFLGLEHRIEPKTIDGFAMRLAESVQPTRLGFAYPGVWLRDDVYAFHGHYADVHITLPTFERLGAAALAHWATEFPQDLAKPDDYEAVLSPLYALIHTLAQRAQHGLASSGASMSARVWVALAGEGRRRRPLRAAGYGLGFAAAVGVINALGLGPVSTRLSGTELRRSGLRSTEEVLRRLELNPAHVVFGHTHRSGPWPDDDINEWTTSAGTRLINTGSWVYQPHFVDGMSKRSAYWPGTAVLIEGDKPPRLLSLLSDFSSAQLRPSGS